MVKDTTRKKALKLFQEILRAKRTDESNRSIQVQKQVLAKKMKQAKTRALREQRKKQAEMDKAALAAQVKPVLSPLQDAELGQRFLDKKIIVTEQLPPKEHFSTLQQAYDPSFKEIIKHGF